MKVLLTGGCSFSEIKSASIDKDAWNWPKFLHEHFKNTELISDAVGGQGNDLISRQIIYRLVQLLKSYNSNDILVGIMWSHPDRIAKLVNIKRHKEFDNGQKVNHTEISIYKDYERYNPYTWMPLKESANKAWGILSYGNKFSEEYYEKYHDYDQGLYYTLEHILRIQWFLKLNKIPYFMSTYKEILNKNQNTNITDHLFEQIDFSHFLPVPGEYEWVVKNKLPFRDEYGHPSGYAHSEFVNQVVMPFLRKKKYI